jgi:hypothetical protein
MGCWRPNFKETGHNVGFCIPERIAWLREGLLADEVNQRPKGGSTAVVTSTNKSDSPAQSKVKVSWAESDLGRAGNLPLSEIAHKKGKAYAYLRLCKGIYAADPPGIGNRATLNPSRQLPGGSLNLGA